MSKLIRLLLCTVIISASHSVRSDVLELTYPDATNILIIDESKASYHDALARSIGFQLNRKYSYSEYVKINRQNQVGIAGEYDFLLLSTGGSAWITEDLNRMNQVGCGWEMTYYSNHDLTVIHEVCSDESRQSTYVKILKLSKGKKLKLYAE